MRGALHVVEAPEPIILNNERTPHRVLALAEEPDLPPESLMPSGDLTSRCPILGNFGLIGAGRGKLLSALLVRALCRSSRDTEH
jgi:hypothetical protein